MAPGQGKSKVRAYLEAGKQWLRDQVSCAQRKIWKAQRKIWRAQRKIWWAQRYIWGAQRKIWRSLAHWLPRMMPCRLLSKTATFRPKCFLLPNLQNSVSY